MPKGRKRTRTIPQHSKKGKTWADVAYRCIDGLYNLTNTGNLVGAIIFGIIILGWIVGWRMPPSDLSTIVSGIGGFFTNEKFYVIPFVSLLTLCVFLKIRMNRVYKSEIQRLTDLRKKLMHGLENGNLKPIQKHTSAGYDLSES